MRRLLSLLVVFASLVTLVLACNQGELVEDTGYACVISEPFECVCREGVPSDVCLLDPLDYLNSICTGPLPPDTRLSIEVWLGHGQGDSWDIECEAEPVGGNVLEIHAHYRWKQDQDADGEPDVIASCQTPPLSAGVWTLRYGEGERHFTVSPESQNTPCVESGKQK
ncbi:hypothetical protein ACNOYE_01965 [Nannocystaceae bacterium ST9]